MEGSYDGEETVQLDPKSKDYERMIAAEVHIGTKNMNFGMRDYVWKRRDDNVHILNIGKTWDKIMFAARVIVAVENPEDVIAISARPYGQRAVLKYANYTGATAIAGRFTPGTFTNQITKAFKEPRLLIITDPRTDSQPVIESSYGNIPVIAFCDSDSPVTHVDVAIPANNKGKHSIGLVYWLLAREVNRLRGNAKRDAEWNVSVDLFFYRDPEELLEDEAEDYEDVANPDWEAGGDDNAAGGGGDWGEGDAAGGAGGDDNWNEPGAAAAGEGDNWTDPAAATEAAPPVPAVQNVGWEGAADDTPAAAGDWAPGAGGAAATDAPETSGW
jgi:small subunit ribosomal protein SAe